MFFFAAIGSTPHKPLAQNCLTNSCCLIPDRHTDDVAAFELAAGSFRLVLFQSSKTRAVERLVALDHRFGERIAALQQARGFCFCGSELLARFSDVFISADLDDPAAARFDVG